MMRFTEQVAALNGYDVEPRMAGTGSFQLAALLPKRRERLGPQLAAYCRSYASGDSHSRAAFRHATTSASLVCSKLS